MSTRRFMNVALALLVELGGAEILTKYDGGDYDEDPNVAKMPDREKWGTGPDAEAGLRAAMALVGGAP